MRNKMNAKQQKFVLAWLKCDNISEAARESGYSIRYAYNLVEKPHIRDYYEKEKTKLLRRQEVSAERVLQEIARLGFSNIRDIASWEQKREEYQDENGASTFPEDITGEDDKEEGTEYRIIGGVQVKPSDQLADDAAAAIQEISDTKYGLRVKLHNKMSALEVLAKITDLLPKGAGGSVHDPIHHQHNVSLSDLFDPDTREAVIREYLELEQGGPAEDRSDGYENRDMEQESLPVPD